MRTDDKVSVVATPRVIGLTDLLGVVQHRSDQSSLSIYIPTFGISDVTVIVKTLPGDIPACLFSLHSSASTFNIMYGVSLKAQSQSQSHPIPSPTH